MTSIIAVLKAFSALLKHGASLIIQFVSSLIAGMKILVSLAASAVLSAVHRAVDLFADLMVLVKSFADRLHGIFPIANTSREIDVDGAFQRWMESLSQAFLTFYAIQISLLNIVCLVTASVVIAWLLLKFLLNRSFRVFISFGSTNEERAVKLAQALALRKINIERLPFNPKAKHQDLLESIYSMLNRSHILVCLPGPGASFVESEVSAATAQSKPVVFCIEPGDTLPNTANKRYPVFEYTSTLDRNFDPLASFLHYIAGTHYSMASQLLSAARAPMVSWTVAKLLKYSASLSASLFLLALVTASLVGGESGMSLYDKPGVLETLLAHGLVFLVIAGVLTTALAYFTYVLLSFRSQLLAQRMARLAIRDAVFSRDDWAKILPLDTMHSNISEFMFNEAPLAHHEATDNQLSNRGSADEMAGGREITGIKDVAQADLKRAKRMFLNSHSGAIAHQLRFATKFGDYALQVWPDNAPGGIETAIAMIGKLLEYKRSHAFCISYKAFRPDSIVSVAVSAGEVKACASFISWSPLEFSEAVWLSDHEIDPALVDLLARCPTVCSDDDVAELELWFGEQGIAPLKHLSSGRIGL